MSTKMLLYSAGLTLGRYKYICDEDLYNVADCELVEREKGLGEVWFIIAGKLKEYGYGYEKSKIPLIKLHARYLELLKHNDPDNAIEKLLDEFNFVPLDFNPTYGNRYWVED